MKSLYDPLHRALVGDALYSQTFKQMNHDPYLEMNHDPYLELKTNTYWAIRLQLSREMFDEMQEQIRGR